jgi:hypothetical protein
MVEGWVNWVPLACSTGVSISAALPVEKAKGVAR